MARPKVKQELIPFPRYPVSEVELVYRSKISNDNRPRITDSRSAYNLFNEVWDKDKLELCEECNVLYMNRANYVVALYHVSLGGISGTVVDPRLILAAALKLNASGIILAHNHPSGSDKPSRADEELTTKMKFAANYHDIKMYDHIIVTKTGYYSFADNGLI